MLLIQNKAILDVFEVKKIGDSYEFKNKETGSVLIANASKSRNTGFQNLLTSAFFPSSVLIITRYLSNQWSEFREVLRESFSYKGLKFSESYSSYLKFEEKPNLVFGDSFYNIRESVLDGYFNRRYFDSLIDQVLPLLKDEENSLETFFNLFSPDYALRGKFTIVGNSLSNQSVSIFSDSSQVEFDFNLSHLHGKILVGNHGIELVDSSFIKNFDKLTTALSLDGFVSQVPIDKLTEGDKLSYTEDMSNFSNWFYVQNNLVNV